MVLPFGIPSFGKDEEPKKFGVFGDSLFPGIQDFVWDAWKGPELKTEPDKESRVVPSRLLAEGRLEYEKERAKNLVVPDKWAMQTEEKEDYPLTASGAMGKLGAELADRSVKKDEAWWQKALGMMETALVPIDVPAELIYQAYQDPVAEALNKQLPTMRGEEYRESFGGFKSLFRDQGPEHTGIGEVWQRMRRVQEMREQRPWHQQVGQLAVEIGASGGASAIIKGIPLGASKATKALMHGEALALRAVDLGDLTFGTLTKGISTGIRLIGPTKKITRVEFEKSQKFDIHTGEKLPGPELPTFEVPVEVPQFARTVDEAPPSMETAPDDLEGVIKMIEWEENKALRDAFNLTAMERLDTGVLSTNIFTPDRNVLPDPHLMEFMDEKLEHAVKGYEDGVTPTHKMRNAWNKQAYRWAEDSANVNLSPEQRLAAARNLAQIQLTLSTASRPGAIEKLTMRALKEYVEKDADGQLPLRLRITEAAKVSPDEAMLDDMAEATVKTVGKGDDAVRTGVLSSLDHDGYFAVANYLALLEKFGLSKADDALAFEIEGIARQVDAMPATRPIAAGEAGPANLQRLKATESAASVKRSTSTEILRGAEEKLWDTGYGLRYQRATEQLLRNYSLDQISKLLGHKNINTTRGYIRDWVHDMSVEIDSVKEASEHINLFTAERLERIREAAKVARQAMRGGRQLADDEEAVREVGRAKGKEQGLYEYDNFAREVAEGHRAVFFNEDNSLTKIGERHIDSISYTKFREMLENGELKDGAMHYVKEMLFLDGLRKYAIEIKDYTRRLTLEADGIAAGQGFGHGAKRRINAARKSAAEGKAWASKETGLLQRAKILVTAKTRDGKIVPNEYNFEVLGGKGNVDARKEFLSNAGLDPDMSIEDLVGWAQDHMTLFDEYNNTINLSVDHEWTRALNQHKSKMREVLNLEDATIADVLQYWVESANTHATVNRYYEWTEPLGAISRRAYGPFDELAQSVVLDRSGTSSQALSALGKDYNAAMYARLRNDILKDITENSTLNPLLKASKTVDDKGKEVTTWGLDATMSQQQRLDSIAEWAKSDDIVTAFGVHRIYRNLSASSISSRIYRLAREKPYLFGENFFNLADMGRKGSKGNVNTQEAQKFLDEIIGELVQKEDLLRRRPKDAKFEFIAEGDRYVTKVDTVLRRATTRANITIDGMSFRASIGYMPRIDDIVGRINRGATAQRINEFWNKSNWVKPVKPFIDPIVSAVMGGRALIARDIAKGMAARAWMHNHGQDNGLRVAHKVQNLAEKWLGVEYAPVSNEVVKKYGTREGHEFLTALDKYLRPSDEIIQSELDRGTQGKGLNIFEILAKKNNHALEADYTATGARKYMTQWDIVFDEIHPDDWHHYFDFTRAGGADVENVLRYIKGIQEEMDFVAQRRGVNVADIIRDKGAVYLRNYFPRLFLSSRDKITAGRTERSGVLSANYGHFEPRQVKSIVHQLFDNPDNAMLENANVGKMWRSTEDGVGEWVVDETYDAADWEHLAMGGKLLERGSTRLGHYVESIWKEIAEHETKVWMSKHEAYGMGSKSAYQALREKDIFTAEALDPDALRKVGERANKKALTLRQTELDALSAGIAARRAGVSAANAERLEILENSTHPEIQALADLARTIDEGAATAQADELAKHVERLINREQKALNKGLAKFNAISDLKDEHSWLQAKLNGMTEADQREVLRYFKVADSTIMQILLAPAKVLRPVNQILRTAKATFDVGVGMIHGYPSLVNIPLPTATIRGGKGMTQGNWFKSQVKMYQYMLHPTYHDNWVSDNQPFIDMIAPYMEVNKAEQIQLLRGDGTYERIKKMSMRLPGPIGKAQVAARFETGFTGFLDMLRYENAKTHLMELEYYLNKKGIQLYKQDIRTGQLAFNDDVPEVAAKLHEFGAAMNKFTGTFDPNLSMMTPTQSFLESSLLFFAPRYRRAAYGALVDIFRGGMRRDVALRNLAGHVNSWMLYGVIAKEFFGNEEAMDIEQTQKFGKFEVGGIRMGVGTAFSTVFRTAVDLSVLVAQDPEAILEPEDWKDHPVADILLRRIGRSQMAPASALGWDILSGKTYLGDPLRDADDNWDLNEILKHSGRGMIPFWLDGVFAGSAQGAAIAMPAEALGLQAYPIQDYDLLARARQGALENWDESNVQAWRDGVIADARAVGEQPEISWETAPKWVKDLINDGHILVNPMHETYRQNHGEESRGESRQFFRYWQQRGEFETQALDRFDQSARMFELGEADGRDLVEMYGETARFRRNANQALLDKSYPEVRQHFVDIRTGKTKAARESQFLGDIFYDQFMDEFLFNPAYKNQETGDFIWGIYNEALMSWKIRNEMLPGQKNWNFNPDNKEGYIQKRKRQWLTDSPEAGKVLNMFDVLRPYWSLHEDLGWSQERVELADLLLSQSETGKGRFYRYGYTNPLTGEYTPGKVFDKINSQLGAAREKYRRANPMADWMLVKYYRASPSTDFAQTESVRWQRTIEAKRLGQIPLETALGEFNPDTQRIETYITAPSGQSRLRNWEQLLTGIN